MPAVGAFRKQVAPEEGRALLTQVEGEEPTALPALETELRTLPSPQRALIF